jgi:hypothetical protein
LAFVRKWVQVGHLPVGATPIAARQPLSRRELATDGTTIQRIRALPVCSPGAVNCTVRVPGETAM